MEVAKDVGDECLDKIFEKRAVEDTVENIHDVLREARTKMVNNQVIVESYIVTKQLTKSPRDYPTRIRSRTLRLLCVASSKVNKTASTRARPCRTSSVAR